MRNQTKQFNAFSGKRIRQNSAKLAQLKRRSKRLRRIGLTVLDFAHGFNLSQFEQTRKEVRARKVAEQK